MYPGRYLSLPSPFVSCPPYMSGLSFYSFPSSAAPLETSPIVACFRPIFTLWSSLCRPLPSVFLCISSFMHGGWTLVHHPRHCQFAQCCPALHQAHRNVLQVNRACICSRFQPLDPLIFLDEHSLPSSFPLILFLDQFVSSLGPFLSLSCLVVRLDISDIEVDLDLIMSCP